jgi:thiol:disulfide interchange protein DsbD
LQADVTANDDIDQALLQGHFGLPGPPAIIFYGSDGRERKNYRLVGFKPAKEFSAHVNRAIQ